jgi:hypothetical protein
MKTATAVALALLLSPSLAAQTQTLVTGTVVGADGVPWATGLMTSTLISPGGPAPSVTPCNNPTAGCQIQNPLPPTTLATGGVIQGVNLWPNANILPAGTTYTFTVTVSPGVAPPFGTGPQSCTISGVTISGAAQSLTANFNAASCPALTLASSSATGSGPPPGVFKSTIFTGACPTYTNYDAIIVGINNGTNIGPQISIDGGPCEAIAECLSGAPCYATGLPVVYPPLIDNGDFEAPDSFTAPGGPAPGAGWIAATGTFSYDTTTPYEGQYSLVISTTVGFAYAYQAHTLQVTPGEILFGLFAVKENSGTTPVGIVFVGSSGAAGGSTCYNSAAPAAFTLTGCSYTVPAGSYGATIFVGNTTATSGTWTAEFDSIRIWSTSAGASTAQGACTGTATSSSTLGLYGTGPNETLTTCTSTTIGSGQVMNHAGSLFGLNVTATHAGVNASSGVVTVMKNGATTAVTCTIGTGTSCQDNTHVVAFAYGDLVSLEFTTQAAEVLAGVKAVVAAE